MTGKQIALYVASFVLFPLTMVLLALGYWIVFPGVCKKRNANKQTEVVETKKEEE